MRRILLLLGLPILAGCYAPIRSPGIPATSLPDHYRMPMRTASEPVNLGLLAAPNPPHYLLGPGDVLDVTIPDLQQIAQERPLTLQVLDDGAIHVPRVGAVPVQGLTVSEARARLDQRLAASGQLVNPMSSIVLTQKATVRIVVLGEVTQPGVQELPQYENDVCHALASAGGFTDDAGDVVEIHRRASFQMETPKPLPAPPATPPVSVGHSQSTPYGSYRGGGPNRVVLASHSQPQPQAQPTAIEQYPVDNGIIEIPLRSFSPGMIPTEDMRLYPGDVVVVRPRQQEVFYVVGKLSENQRARFTLGDREREIGNGFLLPPNREIDVVTAVAMAGYIDPIDSPTTVTVHRMREGNQQPLLIRVDLIEARRNPRENLYIQPGDIIYLNPDCAWWLRRTLDRFVDNVLGVAVGRLITN